MNAARCKLLDAPSAHRKPHMNRIFSCHVVLPSTALPVRAAVLSALCTLLLSAPALALPPANAERGGGDPAPKPLLSRPAPTPQPVVAAPADTVALLPPGQYLLRLTLKGETLERTVKIVRGGTAITAALGADTLSGSLTPGGQLQLAGGNATDRIELTANVAGGRASGQAQLGRGGNRMNASFTLDPLSGSSKLKEYGAPAPKAGGGFFEQLGKAWSCLKNWSTC